MAFIIGTNGARPERPWCRRLDADERRHINCQVRVLPHDNMPAGRPLLNVATVATPLYSSHPFNWPRDDMGDDLVSADWHNELTRRTALRMCGWQIDFLVGTGGVQKLNRTPTCPWNGASAIVG